MGSANYTEREQTVKVQVEVPLYGSDVHVDVLRDRIRSILNLNFQGAKIVDIETE